ncbi:MAG: sporulation protein YunB [Oscillospiraceae bacterium]|nr:sporulation protein YunB [Oscillospiraceae bacterium]
MTGKSAGRSMRRYSAAGYRPAASKQMRKKQPSRFKRRLFVFILTVLFLTAALLAAIDRAFGPVIREFALVQAKYLAVTTINQACNEELAAWPVSYQQLAKVVRDSSGAVTSVEVDPAAVNDVSARLTLAANAALERMSLKKVRVPLGTVLGSNFLAGRGPLIGFYIQPASYVESSFLSSLEGAGFNQTMHNLVLRMTVVVETFSAGYHTSQTVISDMILAQTVIVGEVPDFYAGTAAGTV